VAHDQPRRAWDLHPADCSCCSDDPGKLDLSGTALRLLVGFGWGGLVIVALDLAGIGGGIGVLFGGVSQ
jgi:hypothetical protein